MRFHGMYRITDDRRMVKIHIKSNFAAMRIIAPKESARVARHASAKKPETRQSASDSAKLHRVTNLTRYFVGNWF
jgi:hypothetical protein